MEKPNVAGLVKFCMTQSETKLIDDWGGYRCCAVGEYWISTGTPIPPQVPGAVKATEFYVFVNSLGEARVASHFSGALIYPKLRFWLRHLGFNPRRANKLRMEGRTYGDIQRGLITDKLVDKGGNYIAR
jgi:hypothetical protein